MNAMKTMFAVLALAILALAGAGPGAAQLLERGVAREGTVLRSQTGGDAFMCRVACSIEAGCAGWSWTRAGETGPQARCDLLSSVARAAPDTCCDSGLGQGGATPPSAAAAPVADSVYANRSRRPDGPPVSLVNIPGGMWDEDEELEDEEQAQEQRQAEGGVSPDMHVPAVTAGQNDGAAPTARIVSTGRPAAGNRPRYSVQQEYAPAPMTAPPPAPTDTPADMADPRWADPRWIGG